MPETDQIAAARNASDAQAPSAGRAWTILGLLFVFTVIMFIARQALPLVMAFDLRKRLSLSDQFYGVIVSALGFGMMTGEFPVGLLMDRIGVRKGLSIVVAWWATATASLALAFSGVQLGVSQFLKGTGECGAYSGGVKTVNGLFEKKDRTLAIGIFNGGSVIGATIAPPVIAILLSQYGFRMALLAPALVGFLWIPLWWFVYRREPAQRMQKAASGISSWQMLGNSSCWAVMLCRFFIGPVMQFYWYWMPLYFKDVRHLSIKEFGFLAWIPYLLGDVGGIAGGWAAGVLLRRGVTVRHTRLILMYGSALVCVLSLAVPYMAGMGAALTAISIAIAADNFLSAHMFAAVTDLFPDEQVGRAAGLMGIAGGLGGMLFPLVTGALVKHFSNPRFHNWLMPDSYTVPFALVALMPLAGTVALFLVGKKYRTLDKPAEAVS